MYSLLAFICLLTSSALALQPIDDEIRQYTTTSTSSPAPTSSPSPEPRGSKPICFTPFDRHHVSNIIEMCTGLIERYVESFGDEMDTNLHWTGNNSERTRPGTVHLPQIFTRHNRTAACLVEVVDRGIGDVFEPSALMGNGFNILNECFTKDDCGEVALPPHYTTALAVCGTYEANRTLASRLRRGKPTLTLGLREHTSWQASEE